MAESTLAYITPVEGHVGGGPIVRPPGHVGGGPAPTPPPGIWPPPSGQLPIVPVPPDYPMPPGSIWPPVYPPDMGWTGGVPMPPHGPGPLPPRPGGGPVVPPPPVAGQPLPPVLPPTVPGTPPDRPHPAHKFLVAIVAAAEGGGFQVIGYTVVDTSLSVGFPLPTPPEGPPAVPAR